MRPTLILLRKSLLTFWRSKPAVIITVLVPIVLIYLFGHVFGLYRKDSGPSGIALAVVNASGEPAAQQLVDALKAEKSFRIIDTFTASDGTRRPLTETDVRRALHDNDYRYALILPPDLLGGDALGLHLVFLTNPRNDIEAQTVNGLLQKTIFANVPQLLGQSLQRSAAAAIGQPQLDTFNRTLAATIASAFGGDEADIRQRIESGNFFSAPTDTASSAPVADASAGAVNTTPADSSATDFLSQLIRIETEQVAGQNVKNPMAARLVGGYAIMFLLFAVSSAATSFFDEKSSGVFQRLLSSPVRPAHILWSRFCFGVILGLAQIAALFVAGRIFFGLEIVAHVGPLLAVSLSAAAACSAFGLLVTAISPNADAASPIATLVILSMSAIGGAWFPVSFMPDYIQTLSKLTLVYWAVEGFTDVLWAGRSFIDVLPKIGVLTGIAATVMAVTVWRFKRSKFFE
jgi:ABC-2 type transport system permease protein